jgi:hypothetical protein
MAPKHRQLHAPRPKASGNAYQALVAPPHDGNNLSFDGGDERTDGSDDNTIVIVNPRDSGPSAPASLQKDIDTLGHLNRTAMALTEIQMAYNKLADNYDRYDLYIRELNRTLMVISDGQTTAHDNDRACTDDRFAAIERKMDSLLQKMDVTCTRNTVLREAYRTPREETVALKASVDTLTKKLDENIAITAPPSPKTATSCTVMEEMTMQLTDVQHDIQDILDAVRNPPGKRKRRTSDQDNELRWCPSSYPIPEHSIASLSDDREYDHPWHSNCHPPSRLIHILHEMH